MDDTRRTSTWRDKYKVHPAADLFPPMSDDELAALGEDIKARGLIEPIKFRGDELIDGRNRMEAMERAGIKVDNGHKHHLPAIDAVAYIIGANIRRRHLSSGQLADILVNLAKIEVRKKTGSSDPVSKGGRGKKSAVKAKALEINSALPKEQQVSEPTIKRAMAKADGKTPEPKRYAARPMPKPKSGKPVIGIDAVRQCYLDRCAEPDIDLDAEQKIVFDAWREIAGKRAMQAQSPWTNRTPDIGQLVDDLLLGDIPECRDRRRRL